MKWINFISLIAIAYLVYYSAIILYDMFIKGQSVTDVSNGKTIYSLDLVEENETPVKASELVSEIVEEPTDNSVSEEISFNTPPSNQGIPLSEFLKQAKEKSSLSANKVQFS